MAEVLGVREALSWIKKKSWNKVAVETDNVATVQSIRTTVSMLSYFGSLVSDCRDLISALPDVSLVFIRRSANSTAHFLARASCYVADRVIRKEDISPELLNVIMSDC